MDMLLKRISMKIPEFCMSHWLLRIPLAIIFIQQGLSKFPVTAEDAEAFELPYLVWWFVSYGELGAGIGLLVGGLFAAKLASIQKIVPELGDMVTRFSGITICSITTGIIWISQPESLIDVILYDNLHVFLWVGGRFFALSGNRTLASLKVKEPQMRKNDQVKVETAAEIYSKIKVKTMIAITALFFSSMILAFVSIFIKG